MLVYFVLFSFVTCYLVTSKYQLSTILKFRGGDCSNKEDSLYNQANKQPLIRLISERMRERGCHVIHAEEDADVDIVKAAVSMASSKTTTHRRVYGSMVLLLQYTPNNNAKKIYFRSDIRETNRSV